MWHFLGGSQNRRAGQFELSPDLSTIASPQEIVEMEKLLIASIQDASHFAFQEMACIADWKKSEYFTLNHSAAGELVF